MTDPIIFGIAVLFGFYMAWNIGANDVANAMGTSVASGALRLNQAALIAGVMNFLGALLVGVHVTNTVRKGVINPEHFQGEPTNMILGMIAVLSASGIWVMFASWKEWPVSTTHSVIGALVGFGIAAKGLMIINWTLIGFVVLSWIISPVAGGLISYLVFSVIRKLVFNKSNPFLSAKRIGPYFSGAIAFFLTLALLFKGLKNLHLELTFLQSTVIAGFVAIITIVAVYFLLRNRQPSKSSAYDSVEELAKPLQVVSAAYESFANGANDVANAIGPVAAILAILDSGSVNMVAPVPIWLLALGGFGIWVGISTWGWRVMGTIGKKITHITPSRGFSAEFGTATTVLICSQLGMPVSTTHTSVGNVIGVGLARGISGINLRVVWKIVSAWIWTLPVAGVFSAVIYKLLCWAVL